MSWADPRLAALVAHIEASDIGIPITLHVSSGVLTGQLAPSRVVYEQAIPILTSQDGFYLEWAEALRLAYRADPLPGESGETLTLNGARWCAPTGEVWETGAPVRVRLAEVSAWHFLHQVRVGRPTIGQA